MCVGLSMRVLRAILSHTAHANRFDQPCKRFYCHSQYARSTPPVLHPLYDCCRSTANRSAHELHRIARALSSRAILIIATALHKRRASSASRSICKQQNLAAHCRYLKLRFSGAKTLTWIQRALCIRVCMCACLYVCVRACAVAPCSAYYITHLHHSRSGNGSPAGVLIKSHILYTRNYLLVNFCLVLIVMCPAAVN